MCADFSDISPHTLAVSLVEGGTVVTYRDGREVFYHGVPEQVTTPHETAPGKDVHVLVTDETESQGVLLYVNERKTADEILEGSGVGRVLLGQGEEATLFPGVRVTGGGVRSTITLEPDLVDGRVFVFEEDQFQEFSYELVGQGDSGE